MISNVIAKSPKTLKQSKSLISLCNMGWESRSSRISYTESRGLFTVFSSEYQTFNIEYWQYFLKWFLWFFSVFFGEKVVFKVKITYFWKFSSPRPYPSLNHLKQVVKKKNNPRKGHFWGQKSQSISIKKPKSRSSQKKCFALGCSRAWKSPEISQK